MNKTYVAMLARIDDLAEAPRLRTSVAFGAIASVVPQVPQAAMADAAPRILALLRRPMVVDAWPDPPLADACVGLLSWPLPGLAEAVVAALVSLYVANGDHPGLGQALSNLATAQSRLNAEIATQVTVAGRTPLVRDGVVHLPSFIGAPQVVAGDRLFIDLAQVPSPTASPNPAYLRFALERRRAWLRERFDCTYAVLLAPEKQTIFADQLPATAISYLQALAPVRQAIQDSGTLLCHPVAALQALAAGGQDPFYATDSHWNDLGAFTAYRALLRDLAPQLPLAPVEEDRFRWKERMVYTDLGMGRIPEVREATRTAHFDDGAVTVTAKSALPSARYGWQVYENRDRSLPVAVVFRDSFFTAMIPFMARSLSKLVCVGANAGEMLVDLIEEVRPDLVLTSCVEHFALGMQATDLFRDEVAWKDGVNVVPAMDGKPVPHFGSAVDDGALMTGFP